MMNWKPNLKTSSIINGCKKLSARELPIVEISVQGFFFLKALHTRNDAVRSRILLAMKLKPDSKSSYPSDGSAVVSWNSIESLLPLPDMLIRQLKWDCDTKLHSQLNRWHGNSTICWHQLVSLFPDRALLRACPPSMPVFHLSFNLLLIFS